MENKSKSFYTKLIILTIITLLAVIGLKFILPEGWISPVAPYLLILFPSVSASLYILLDPKRFHTVKSFQSTYFGLSIGRFFVYLAVLIAYMFFFKSDAKAFVVNFLLLYVVFFIFDIKVTLKQNSIKNDKKK